MGDPYMGDPYMLTETPESPPAASDICEPVAYKKPITNQSISPEENLWLRAIFKLCDTSSDGYIHIYIYTLMEALCHHCECFFYVLLANSASIVDNTGPLAANVS